MSRHRIPARRRRPCRLGDLRHDGPVYVDGDLTTRINAAMNLPPLHVFGICTRCGDTALVHPNGTPAPHTGAH
jgi:hypothetical protein